MDNEHNNQLTWSDIFFASLNFGIYIFFIINLEWYIQGNEARLRRIMAFEIKCDYKRGELSNNDGLDILLLPYNRAVYRFEFAPDSLKDPETVLVTFKNYFRRTIIKSIIKR